MSTSIKWDVMSNYELFSHGRDWITEHTTKWLRNRLLVLVLALHATRIFAQNYEGDVPPQSSGPFWAIESLSKLQWGMSASELSRALGTQVEISGFPSDTERTGTYGERQIVWCGRPLIIGGPVSVGFHNNGLSWINLSTLNERHDGELIGAITSYFGVPKVGVPPMYPSGKAWIWNDNHSRVIVEDFGTGSVRGQIIGVRVEDRRFGDLDWSSIESDFAGHR